MQTLKAETSGYMVLLLVQLTFLLIFGLYGRYDEALMPADTDESRTVEEEKEANMKANGSSSTLAGEFVWCCFRHGC